jgi:hypothetical protein
MSTRGKFEVCLEVKVGIKKNFRASKACTPALAAASVSHWIKQRLTVERRRFSLRVSERVSSVRCNSHIRGAIQHILVCIKGR